MTTIRASKLALALLLAASPAALAGSTTTQSQQPAENTQAQTQPAQAPAADDKAATGQMTTEQQPSTDQTGQTNQTGQATGQTQTTGQDTTAPQTTTTTEAEQPVEIPGQILLQSDNSVLASSLIGAEVLSPDQENVGEVSDIIIGLDGQVMGVVVGVGGFLGIGKKLVAIEMSSFEPKLAEDKSTVQLFLNSTREDLEKAPEFKTAAQQKQEEDAAKAQQNMQNQMQNNGSQVPTVPGTQPPPQPQQ